MKRPIERETPQPFLKTRPREASAEDHADGYSGRLQSPDFLHSSENILVRPGQFLHQDFLVAVPLNELLKSSPG